MGTKLYVGNMSYKVTTEDLQKRFSEAGEVVSVNIVFDKFTGQSKGFGLLKWQRKQALRKQYEQCIMPHCMAGVLW